MAVIGCLGDIIFTVSDKEVLTIQNWKWSGSARYPAHQRHLTHALTEFTGIDPDKITFEIMLETSMGVKVMDQIVKIWKYEREGIPVPLTIGTRTYGKYRWNIVRHDSDLKYTTPEGEVISATVSLTLQEYIGQ